MNEKRTYTRYKIWFPVTVGVGEGEVWAICRDGSAGGFLLSTVTPLDVGAHITLRFQVRPESKNERVLTAKVVRQEASVGELMLAFPYRAAVELETPETALVDELERFSEGAA